MAEYTNNLKLKKPDRKDYYNINDVNNNMDILDEFLCDYNYLVNDIQLITAIENIEIPSIDGLASKTYVSSQIDEKAEELVTKDYFYKYTDLLNEDLDRLATIDFVNEEISKIEVTGNTEVNLDGYATEDFVNNEISKIEKTEVNLEGYATEDFVKDEISKIEKTEVNLEGYATEDFVNDKVENLATEDYINQKIEELNINSESTDISSKKYSTVVIGSATVGYTEKDVDFLCSGTDDQIVINQAIQSMTNGGELKILEGDYNITDSILVDIDNIDIVMTSGTNLIGETSEESTTFNNTSTRNKIINITGSNISIRGGNISNRPPRKLNR